MLKGIENIIFDLGGVIINLNQDLTHKAFKELFDDNFDKIIAEATANNIFEHYETGNLSTLQFLNFFQKYKPVLSHQQLISAWNSMLLDIPKSRIDLIKELSKNYNVYLLSNTNEIHYNYIEDYYQRIFIQGNFESLFNKVYLSYQVRLRKPTLEIFEFVLDNGSLNPEKTLFIDDSLEHINSALKLGIKAQHLNLNNNDTLTTLLNEY
ncbi:MAG: HAD family phosphatase [Flavobacteriales bacterium]|nr:HAD family phosphatase [Flavobacteriales bacterium]MCB9173017.1 HAD family phosphatase [Flavobacteriales bacterium]